MSVKSFSRVFGLVWRRSFATSPLKGQLQQKTFQSQKTSNSSKFSGRSVIALTATAGALGFSLATASLQQVPKKRNVVLLDSKIPSPQYASVDELEAVSVIYSMRT